MQTPATHELSPVMSRSAIGAARMDLLQPYCNLADTHWHTMDKTIPPDDPKLPKYAQFPDALVRASMYASKLVTGAGVSGSQVRSPALCFIVICRENFGIQRGLGAKAGANLLQPAEEAIGRMEAMCWHSASI